MCVMCEGKEIISRTVDLSATRDLTTSVRFDSEYDNILDVRVQMGSLGYTLPIQVNYCFACGRELSHDRNEER